ncbi:MAG: hypothetical protein KIS73_19535 [Enhydrobacter sp.]|nr:hypothetical protein [Enhydrobacter sp.]
MSEQTNLKEMSTPALLGLIESNDLARELAPAIGSARDAVEEMCAIFELERRGIFLAAETVIAWCDDSKGKAELVSVEHKKHLRSLQGASNLRGADVDGDWMKVPAATPEAVFLHMAETGFTDRAELASALEAFGKIIECGWARKLRTAAQRLPRPDCEIESD